jgi:type I restriction enzyme R subunit
MDAETAALFPDVFRYNELLVISDGTEAPMGSLSASQERFMRWRTIDGKTLDPLGQFCALETLFYHLLICWII